MFNPRGSAYKRKPSVRDTKNGGKGKNGYASLIASATAISKLANKVNMSPDAATGKQFGVSQFKNAPMTQKTAKSKTYTRKQSLSKNIQLNRLGKDPKIGTKIIPTEYMISQK